jgi:hypothetical protein
VAVGKRQAPKPVLSLSPRPSTGHLALKPYRTRPLETSGSLSDPFVIWAEVLSAGLSLGRASMDVSFQDAVDEEFLSDYAILS